MAMLRKASIRPVVRRDIALRTSAPSEVPPGSSGLGTGDPNPGRRADGDGTDHGEDELPGLRRHGVLRDTVNGMIASDGRWCCEDKSDGQPEPDRTREGEEELADAEHQPGRSEEHTSELQSLMRISYAVFCLEKKKHIM